MGESWILKSVTKIAHYSLSLTSDLFFLKNQLFFKNFDDFNDVYIFSYIHLLSIYCSLTDNVFVCEDKVGRGWGWKVGEGDDDRLYSL